MSAIEKEFVHMQIEYMLQLILPWNFQHDVYRIFGILMGGQALSIDSQYMVYVYVSPNPLTYLHKIDKFEHLRILIFPNPPPLVPSTSLRLGHYRTISAPFSLVHFSASQQCKHNQLFSNFGSCLFVGRRLRHPDVDNSNHLLRIQQLLWCWKIQYQFCSCLVGWFCGNENRFFFNSVISVYIYFEVYILKTHLNISLT